MTQTAPAMVARFGFAGVVKVWRPLVKTHSTKIKRYNVSHLPNSTMGYLRYADESRPLVARVDSLGGDIGQEAAAIAPCGHLGASA